MREKERTRLRKLVQIPANPLELRRRHLNRSRILCLGNSQVLLVDVHQLDIILAYPVGLRALEHEVNRVGGVLGLERQDIFVLGGPQNFGQRDQVDSQRDVTVAAVGGEAIGAEQHGDQGNVGVVHGLEGDSGVIAVEVAVLDEVFDGVGDLAIVSIIHLLGFQSMRWSRRTRLRRLACSRRASNTVQQLESRLRRTATKALTIEYEFW